MLLRRSEVSCVVACALIVCCASGRYVAAQAVQGAGSTFVAPIMAKWADDYNAKTGMKVSYLSVGSGAGIQKIQAGEVDFGASDKPLSPGELAKGGLCQFPIVIGGVVPVVNLPGVASGQIEFSGELLADIFLGKVTSWDDPEVKAANPKLNLPAAPISVVHRSDGSGTTYNFVDYLARASAAWKDKVGVGLSVTWPVDAGGDGNAGVAAAVTQTPGSIGYVEYAYALQNNLTFGDVENLHKLFVDPGADTFQAAASTVDWSDHKDFSVLMTEAGGPDAYPITATTFILMYRSPKDPARSAAVLAFFKWALEDGDAQASELHYVPLPPKLDKLVEAYWASQIRAAPAGN